MPRVARSETILTKQLSPTEQGALADELYESINEIFGVTRDEILHGVVAPKSDVTKLLVHRRADGSAVGYFGIHFFDKRLRGVPTTVIRAGVGMRRDYRGQNNNLSWALRVLAEHVVANPQKPLYGLGSLVHPSSYIQVDRYVDVYWPRHDEPVAPEILDFMFEMADEFHLHLVDPTRPLIRKASNFKTIETEAERDYWRRSDRPAARFFMSMAPDYGDGRGMLTLFPINPTMLARATARYAREKATRAAERMIAKTQRLPIGGRLVRSSVSKRLQAVPLFAALDAATLGRLVERSEMVSLPSGKHLFRAGDEGDDLFLVARGAVSVVRDSEGGEVIDQLGSGSLVGEGGVLTGGRRSTSIRAAIPSTLVRIPGAALRAVMASSPEVRDAIWSEFAVSIFGDHLRASGRVPELGRLARVAWLGRGRHEELEAGASVATEGDAFLLVLRGAVSVEHGAQQRSANGPVVLEADASTRIVTATSARVVHVPALVQPSAVAQAHSPLNPGASDT
jgi:CRP-like cAMP-binding protein